MPLILAIEPDRKQSSKIAALAKGPLQAELVIAESGERAIQMLGERVPDLVLTSMLLSPKDEAVVSERLRDLDAAGTRVQTLVIPVLGNASQRKEKQGGLLGGLFGAREKDSSPDGCDPAVFAAQITEYLERAACERRAAALEGETSKRREPLQIRPEPAAEESVREVFQEDRTVPAEPAYGASDGYVAAYEPAAPDTFVRSESVVYASDESPVPASSEPGAYASAEEPPAYAAPDPIAVEPGEPMAYGSSEPAAYTYVEPPADSTPERVYSSPEPMFSSTEPMFSSPEPVAFDAHSLSGAEPLETYAYPGAAETPSGSDALEASPVSDEPWEEIVLDEDDSTSRRRRVAGAEEPTHLITAEPIDLDAFVQELNAGHGTRPAAEPRVHERMVPVEPFTYTPLVDDEQDPAVAAWLNEPIAEPGTSVHTSAASETPIVASRAPEPPAPAPSFEPAPAPNQPVRSEDIFEDLELADFMIAMDTAPAVKTPPAEPAPPPVPRRPVGREPDPVLENDRWTPAAETREPAWSASSNSELSSLKAELSSLKAEVQSRKAEADAAKVRAEAEAVKVMAEAEAAKVRAEAEAARVRAEAEVAKVRAEAEAAKARAQAQAESAPPAPPRVEPPPAAPQADWVELLTAIKKDIEQLRSDRPEAAAVARPPAAKAPAGATPVPQAPGAARSKSSADLKKKKKKKAPQPVQDEWGFFDPEQAGFAALLQKLEESEDEDSPKSRN
jgi:hypothetical protein